jgi:hypothetical protein
MSTELLRIRQIVSSPTFKQGPSPEFARLRSTLFAGVSTANRLRIQQLVVKMLRWSSQNPHATAGQMQNIFRGFASAMTPLQSGQAARSTEYTTDALLTYALLRAVQANLQNVLDSENENSEMVSLREVLGMDRRSKFVEALSNVMKKIDSTQETIVQNLKG